MVINKLEKVNQHQFKLYNTRQAITLPGKRIHIDGIVHLQKKNRSCRIDKVVFIDSTWHQVHKISSDERISSSIINKTIKSYHTIHT